MSLSGVYIGIHSLSLSALSKSTLECSLVKECTEVSGAPSSGGFVHHLCMILQMHCAVQGHVAPGMRARYQLTVRMVAKMLAMEVLLEVAARRESLQPVSG